MFSIIIYNRFEQWINKRLREKEMAWAIDWMCQSWILTRPVMCLCMQCAIGTAYGMSLAVMHSKIAFLSSIQPNWLFHFAWMQQLCTPNHYIIITLYSYNHTTPCMHIIIYLLWIMQSKWSSNVIRAFAPNIRRFY